VAAPLRIVYVAGSSHSGSTLLALLGDQHPRVASVGEASVKPAIRRARRAARQQCSCGARLDQCPFWRRVFDQVTRDATRFDASCWSNDYRFEHPWLDRLFTRETSYPAVRRARRWAARHLPGYRQRVARIDQVNVAFVRAVLDQTGATVLLDTTKLLTRLTHLREIETLDIKVVWLTRDVRGVAWSARRRGASIDDAARTWRHDQEAIAHALSDVPRDRRLQLRYEDLCRDPRPTLGRLWDFCGVPPIEPSLTLQPAAQHVLGNRMRISGVPDVRLDEGWRISFDGIEQQRVLAIAGGIHRDLGYR
jgi:hypothetical protein